MVKSRQFWQDIECSFLKNGRIAFGLWIRCLFLVLIRCTDEFIWKFYVMQQTPSRIITYSLSLLFNPKVCILWFSLPQVLITWLYSTTLFIKCLTRLKSRGGRSSLCLLKSMIWCTPKFFVWRVIEWCTPTLAHRMLHIVSTFELFCHL